MPATDTNRRHSPTLGALLLQVLKKQQRHTSYLPLGSVWFLQMYSHTLFLSFSVSIMRWKSISLWIQHLLWKVHPCQPGGGRAGSDTQRWELCRHRHIILSNAKILCCWVNSNFISHGCTCVLCSERAGRNSGNNLRRGEVGCRGWELNSAATPPILVQISKGSPEATHLTHEPPI